MSAVFVRCRDQDQDYVGRTAKAPPLIKQNCFYRFWRTPSITRVRTRTEAQLQVAGPLLDYIEEPSERTGSVLEAALRNHGRALTANMPDTPDGMRAALAIGVQAHDLLLLLRDLPKVAEAVRQILAGTIATSTVNAAVETGLRNVTRTRLEARRRQREAALESGRSAAAAGGGKAVKAQQEARQEAQGKHTEALW